MNKKIAGLIILFLVFLINPLMSQYVASLKGDKVEVRDIKGKYLASGYYSHLKDIVQCSEIIVLWYESSKVEVRSCALKYIASGYYSNVKKISSSGDNVVLYYTNGKIEVRDKNLKYISSRYQ